MVHIEVELQRSYVEQGYIGISKKWWDSFPTSTEDVELETEVCSDITTKFSVEKGIYHSHRGFSGGLKRWFKESGAKKGDTITITPIKDMKRYRLEITKRG